MSSLSLLASRSCLSPHNGLLTSNAIKSLSKIPAANICHKDKIDPIVSSLKAPPFPYEKKKYNMIRYLLNVDPVSSRLDENSVFISVDGPPACGKSKLAKDLAEAINAKHVPMINMDVYYKNDYGFDLRSFNRLLYRDAQHVDTELWLQDPSHPRAGFYQREFYKVKFWHYLNHLLHLMSTGQGVVMERCPHTDMVFPQAMYQAGYISKDILDFYSRTRWNTIDTLWRPHVIIYIDASKEQVLENIKKRNIPYEVNSPVWETNFVDSMIDCYKNRVLPELDEHAFIVNLPYQESYDCDGIVDQLEKLPIAEIDIRSTKLEDWKIPDDDEWSQQRWRNCSMHSKYMAKFVMPTWDVPHYDYEDEAQFVQANMEKFLNPRPFRKGYDPYKEGLLKVLFGNRLSYWDYRKKGPFFRSSWIC